MGTPIETVTIVGGGTAGWLCATMLRTLAEKSLKIQLVESPNIPTVGAAMPLSNLVSCSRAGM